MLELSHVTKRFGTRTVVDDLCLTVPDHCIFGFVGENGAGKTTTMKMILGLLDTDAGEIRVHGEQVSFGKSRANHFIGYLPDVPEFYGFLTPEGYLLLCGEISGISKKEGKERAKELLALVGLSKTKQRIQGFSRGMKQRLGIAQALFGNPKLLICDEPTTALDVTIQAQILKLIHDLQSKLNLTTIYITHDLGVVANVADRIAVMYAGDIIEVGGVNEIFYDPRHPYTWALLSSLPQLGIKGEDLFSIAGTPPNLQMEIKGDAFAPRNPYALNIDFVERPPFFDVSPTHKARTWLMDPRAPKLEPPEAVRRLAEGRI